MKRILFFVLTSIAFVCSCSKENSESGINDSTQVIYANVNVPTKVAYAENVEGGGGGISSCWENGDWFNAIQDGVKVVTFRIVSGAGTSSAVFSCETSDVTESTTWTAVLGTEISTHNNNEIHCGYNQSHNANVTELKKCNFVVAKASGLTPSFDFENGTKLSAVLRIKLPAGVKCIEYTPCASHKVTEEEISLMYLNGAEENDFTAHRTKTIVLDEASTKGQLAYIAVPALDYSSTFQTFTDGAQSGNLRTGIILTLMNDESDNATLSNGVVYDNNISGKEGCIGTVDLSELTLIARAKPSDAIKLDASNVSFSYNSNAFMQAASKVTVYWAPFNIGASTVGEVGKRFAFGEIFDNGVYTEDAYSMKHNSSGKYDVMTNLRSAIVDNANNKEYYSLAGSRYDAARVIWGSAWRMPHVIDVKALIQGSCTAKTVGGVDGTEFANGGNPIFIPTCGKKAGNTTKDATYGYIRPADHYTRSSTNAQYGQALTPWIKVGDIGIGRDAYNIEGVPIRPVLDNASYE